MTRQQNEYKILLKSLEDDLLMRLSSAGDNILSDSALVENLEFTKKTAADIEIKVINVFIFFLKPITFKNAASLICAISVFF